MFYSELQIFCSLSIGNTPAEGAGHNEHQLFASFFETTLIVLYTIIVSSDNRNPQQLLESIARHQYN
jgi:hypothetical protein